MEINNQIDVPFETPSVTAVPPAPPAIPALPSKDVVNSSAGAVPPKLPWDKNSANTPSKSVFFPPIDIDTDRWDALFPYRLCVIDAKTGGLITGESDKPEIIGVDAKGSDVSKGTTSYLIEFSNPTSTWSFRLPITPQQLSIQDNFSIQTTATLRGVLEEHSGVRFKTIVAQGTLGVWPQRSTISDSVKLSEFQNFFAGTVTALSALGGSVTSLYNLVTGNIKKNKPKTIRPENSGFGPESTGYYRALKLQQFLEQYAEAKKDPKNANWRLVFDIPKQNQSFIVTPVAYSWQQNANRPLEINFTFQLKAWRRINLGLDQFSTTEEPDSSLNASTLSNVLNTIDNARRVISNTVNLIKAVRSDIQKIFDVIRRTALFIKDLIGAVKSIIDLPNKIISDLKSTIADSLKILKSAISENLSDSKSINALNSVSSSTNNNEGLSKNAVSNGQLGTPAANSSSLDPSNGVFNEPEVFYDLLNSVPISGLSLNSTQNEAINNVL